jgi:hypothetical protein
VKSVDGHAIGFVRFHASRFMMLNDDSPSPVFEDGFHEDALSSCTN